MDGVVVTFGLRTNTGETYRLRVLHPTSSSTATVVQSSAYQGVAGIDHAFAFDVRLPVSQNDIVALGMPSSGHVPFANNSGATGGCFSSIAADPADGASGTMGPCTGSEEILYNATIEPDRDHDGYGDETQDQCPSAPGPGPCLGPPSGGGGQPPPPDVTPPVISSFLLSPSSFVAASSGPSATAAAKVGTTGVYKLSEAATTTFTVERRSRGVRKGRRCAAGHARRARQRCTRYVRQPGSFSLPGTSGLNSFRFTGRIAGRALTRGNYRLVGIAADAAGNHSAATGQSFRILH
jgi:hypothetical protein